MTEMQNEKIRWLSRARKAEHKLKALHCVRKRDDLLIRELEAFEDCAELYRHLQEIELQTRQQLILLAGIRDEIRTAIETLPDLQLQAVMDRKYLAYQTNEQIAEAMYFEVRTIQRKHKKALDLLTLPDKSRISETTIFQNITCEN